MKNYTLPLNLLKAFRKSILTDTLFFENKFPVTSYAAKTIRGLRHYRSLMFIFCTFFLCVTMRAQVTVTASMGVTGPTVYPTLGAAFSAINSGAHQGSIFAVINASTVEGLTPATINGSGAGLASYTNILIQAGADSVTVSGSPGSGYGVIQLNGASNITINGESTGRPGERNLYIINTSAATATYSSCIRLATSAGAGNCNNISLRYCNLLGNATDRNAPAFTSATGSENTSFGIYAGGNAGLTGIASPLALTSVTSNPALAGTTINGLDIDHNLITASARAIVVNGADTTVADAVQISKNIIGADVSLTGNAPYNSPATTVYSTGIFIAGVRQITISGNTIHNIMSYTNTTLMGIDLNNMIGANGIILDDNSISVINNGTGGGAGGINIAATQSTLDVRLNIISPVKTLASSQAFGVQTSSGRSSSLIEMNNISGIYALGASGVAYGINITGGNSYIIINNFISDLNAFLSSGSINTAQGIHGIRITSGTSHQIYFNSINLAGPFAGSSASGMASALTITSSIITGLNVRNNIFSNTMTGGPAGTVAACISLPAGLTSSFNYTENNNAYYGNQLGQEGTTAVSSYTISGFDPSSISGTANWRSFTNALSPLNTQNDSVSFSRLVPTPFVTPVNLHVDTTSLEAFYLYKKAAVIPVVVYDIDGQSRSATFPDIGADEFIYPINTYTWTGSTDTAWGVATNWSPVSPAGGPNACTADVVIPLVTNQPAISTPVSVGNIQLNAGTKLTLNANISICKNVEGTTAGTFPVISGNGALVLGGNTSQTISGLIQINELRLNNSAGASMAAASSINIFTSLDLQSGNFDATNGALTFLSTSVSQIAILDNFSPGFSGTITGPVNAQRYYNAVTSANSYDQHFFGSPVNNVPFSQLGASGTAGYLIATSTCDESSIAVGSPYSTVLALDETHGAVCTTNQWIAETASSGNTQNGRGYGVAKIGSGVMTLTGNLNTNSSYTLTGLTNSNWSNSTLQGHTVASGWHLVSNPYLATLNINTINAGFDNQVQVWNSNGPFTGTYQPGTVGTDATIAPFQGFMVHKTNPGGTANYTLNATDLVRTPHTFFRANDNELKIIAENTSTNMLDQTVIAFNTAATDQFDPQYDANKPSGALNRHTLYSVNNGQWMSRNILHDIAQTSTVPVGFEPGVTANYKFSFTGVNTFDATSYIYLEDKTLNLMHDLRAGDYSFTANATDTWDRFIVHFTPALITSITNAGCNTQGIISLVQPAPASWTYIITNSNNQNIASGTLNQSTPVAINAASGTYTLTLTDINNYTVTKVLQVSGPDPVTATFTTSANTVQQGQNLVLTASTPNASAYQWDLGNGQTETGATINYTYPAAGTYTVALTVINMSNCTATTAQTIAVNVTTTGIGSVTENNTPGIWSNGNTVYVDFRQLQVANDAFIAIYDILGQPVSTEKVGSNMLYQKQIDNTSAAYMMVSVKNDNKITTKKVLVAGGN